MLISKFNLYNAEWLDLVFDNRNKNYGAYELRQHYAGNMLRAMGITFSVIAVLCGACIVLSKPKQFVHITEVINNPYVMPPIVAPPVKKVEPPAAPKPERAPEPIKSIKDVPPVVTADNLAQKPVKNIELNNTAIGQTTSLQGKGGDNIDIPDNNNGDGGTGTAPEPDNSIHNLGGLDFMPEPVGGATAWAKFLNKNLRFPPVAQEDGVSGRVILSFIIEKNGTLSNITVDRPAGHGFDEEALRVLKLAKAWKPGMQNGQPVRVKYSIPINFQLAEGN
jgi:protein TonB